MGCAGQVANGINTVHMSFNIQGTGHAIINARQWIPSEHIEDEKTRHYLDATDRTDARPCRTYREDFR